MELQTIQPGSWVARFTGKDQLQIAGVKYVRQSVRGRHHQTLLDVVLYSLRGERLCQGVPPQGETECYARGLPPEGWEVIDKPDFEILAVEGAMAMEKLRTKKLRG